MKARGYGFFPGGNARDFEPDPECPALGSYTYDTDEIPCDVAHPFTTQTCALVGGHEGRHESDDGRGTWALVGESGWLDRVTA